MDVNTIITLISSVGFPIVAAGFIAWYTNKLTDNFRGDVKQLQQEHKEETEKLRGTVEQNTLVIQKLIDKLDDKKEGAA